MESSITPVGLFFTLFALLPVIFVAFSAKARGAEKVGWMILVFVTSWVGFAIFLIVKGLLVQQKKSA